MFFAILVQAALTALNVWIAISSDSPINWAAAAFCGLMTIFTAFMVAKS